MRNPRKGSSGISSSNMYRGSPFQHRERIRIERLAMSKQVDDDREADRGFRGRDRHHEEHDDLPFGRAERPAKRDKRQIDGVQHDFDRQEDRDEIPPKEDAGRADREEDRRKHEVVVQRRHHRPSEPVAVWRPGRRVSRRAKSTAPTMATRISTDVTSKGNPYAV